MLGLITTRNAATTGVKDIAEALGGGIREGSLILIEGDAKAGKSVLSQYIAYGVLCSKDSAVVYYTTDNTVEELIAKMDSLSLYSQQDFASDHLRIYSMDVSDVLIDAQEALQRLINHISALPFRFKLVIVDSVSPLMTRVNPMAKIDFLRACKELGEDDRSIVLAVDAHVFEGKMLARAHDISDYYLKLRSKDMMLETGQVDTRNVKVLEVTKLAGAERRTQDDVKFEIKPKVGIQILPFFKVKV